ncbi:MAG: DMT family transporter [Acidimicrobiales bacterium]
MRRAVGTAAAPWAGVLLIAISAAAFGAMAIFARVAYDSGADVLTVLALRFVLAAAVLHVVVRVQRRPLPRGRTLLALAALGGIGYVGQSSSYFTALTLAPAGVVALLLYLYPAFVTILAVITGRERWTRPRVLALALAMAGTALTIGAGGGNGSPRSGLVLGMLLGVAAAVIYAGYILLSERPTARGGALPSSTVITSSAAVVLGVPAVLAGPELPTGLVGWGAVAGIALVSTVVAIVAFFAGLARLGPSNAATLSTLEPVVTVVLAALFLAESFTAIQGVGAALILAAVVLLVRQGDTPPDLRPSPDLATASTGLPPPHRP